MADAYWKLSVAFPLPGTREMSAMIAQTKAVEDAVGKPLSDAGAGFGFRDVGFVFATEREASAAADRVLASFPDYDIDVSGYPAEED